MLAFLGACVAMLLFVGLKSFQQRNVAFDHLAWIPPTSMAMSWCEFYVLGYVALDVVATGGMSLLFFAKASALGLAAGLGSLGATLLHGRFLGGANGKRTKGGVSSGILAQGVTEVRSDGASQGKRNGEDKAPVYAGQERTRSESHKGTYGATVGEILLRRRGGNS